MMWIQWFYYTSFRLWAAKCKWATLIYLGILSEVYLEPYQIELFAKIFNGFQPMEDVKRLGALN